MVYLLNTLSTSFSSTSQNEPCLDPCTPPGPHPVSLDHHPFRPASVTMKIGKHEAVDLLVHGSDTATPPATAFVTSPPRFRFHHLQKVQTQSKAVRVKAIAHFACSPRCSHHAPSRILPSSRILLSSYTLPSSRILLSSYTLPSARILLSSRIWLSSHILSDARPS